MDKTANEQRKVVSLDDVLGRNKEELTKLREGSYFIRKLNGDLLYAEIEPREYRKAKKACIKFGPKGELQEMDDDKLKALLIVAAVGKDQRSPFRFDDKRLLAHLEINTAQEAVEALLSIGEINGMAVEIQTLSGVGETAEEEAAEDIKN